MSAITKHSWSYRVTEDHYCVTRADVKYAHEYALQSLGGGRDGILNENSLLSALARPYSGYYQSIQEKSAALVESLVCNHGFMDGNKRTAWLVLGYFILRSGYEYTCSQQEIIDIVLKVAKGEIKYDDLVEWFSTRIKRA